MWSTEDVVVISDLHLTVLRNRGLFQADDLLASFLQWLHKELKGCHLVLNGDIFDFLASHTEATLNPADAELQVVSIAQNHTEVFDALSLIVKSQEHEVTILGGNHDPELVLDRVQAKIEEHLKVSCPHSHLRWLTNGEGAFFSLGNAKVLIEHGDQYDPWNWIDHEALRRAICLASRNISYKDIYKSPPGSRLVINRLNVLRDRFNWIETLQPLTPSILPLLLEIVLPVVDSNDRNQILGAVREFKDFAKRSMVETTLTLVKSRSRYWADVNEERQILSEWLAQFKREERSWGAIQDLKAAMGRTVARLRQVYSSAKLKKVARTSSFFQIEAADEQLARVVELIGYGTHLVVHGHTHAAKAYTVGGGLYINTGTWGQLTSLPDPEAGDEEWTNFLDSLRNNSATFSNRPTFARIRKQPDGTTASLCEWTGSGAKILSAWNFTNSQWRKETIDNEH